MHKIRTLTIGLTALVCAAAPATASARDYYVSPSGSDASAGTSSSAPWKSVNKVNGAALAAGDTVSFQGGASFGGTLSPARSGSATAPITFKAYGAGKAQVGGVYMKSVSNLAFQDLKIDGAGQAVLASGSGTGVKSVSFTRMEVRNATLGFNAANTLDQNWTIRDSVIDGIQDTGIHSWAADTKVYNSKISNTGLGHATYSYGLHAMYIKGARFHAAGNEVWNSMDQQGSAISTRYRDAVIEDNYIHDSGIAISYYRDDAGTGTTVIRRNRIASLRNMPALYVGPGNRASGVGENFHVYNNTIVNPTTQSGAAFNWSATGGREFIFRNNAVQGYSSLLRSTSGVQQSHNLLGSLGVVNFVPQAGSKVVDTGTATIKAGAVSLVGGCVAGPLSFCGSAPDVGAVEKQ